MSSINVIAALTFTLSLICHVLEFYLAKSSPLSRSIFFLETTDDEQMDLSELKHENSNLF